MRMHLTVPTKSNNLSLRSKELACKWLALAAFVRSRHGLVELKSAARLRAEDMSVNGISYSRRSLCFLLLAVSATASPQIPEPDSAELAATRVCGFRGRWPKMESVILRECSTYDTSQYFLTSVHTWRITRGPNKGSINQCREVVSVSAAELERNAGAIAMCRTRTKPLGLIKTFKVDVETTFSDKTGTRVFDIYTPGYGYCTHRVRRLSENPRNEATWSMTIWSGPAQQDLHIKYSLPGRGSAIDQKSSWIRFEMDLYMISNRAYVTDDSAADVPEFKGRVQRCNDSGQDFERRVVRPNPRLPTPGPQPNPPAMFPPPDYAIEPNAPLIRFRLCSKFATVPAAVIVADRKMNNQVRYNGSIPPNSCVDIIGSSGASSRYASIWVHRLDTGQTLGINYIEANQAKDL